MAARLLKLVQVQRAAFSTSRVASDTIGFVGLGQMGSRMATNLDKAGHELILNDVNTSFAKQLASGFQNVSDVALRLPCCPCTLCHAFCKATVVDTPQDVAKQATTIVTMLPAG